ncbi:LysM peptidoglycan-binding domain-containing protein [uncultured Pseudokineococcus sp.]|uniref:LysM peptidoglycan-binding domain-containing protein n=1 Tax=uncultured Pseudokineococcus sp. TaxID=1642928 RepID=UPI00261CA94B|nr:LysM peptidoglycan-binding domain-containing protein [uncultured Pseudokineococcus sp.]
MSALVLLPPLSAPTRRRHLVLVPPARVAAPERRARPARRQRAVPGPLHVTRRGRLAATLGVSTLLLVGATVLLAAALAAPAASGAPVTSGAPAVAVSTQAEVVVLPGDTLWSIADEVAVPGEDVRDVVLVIQEMNEMSSAAVSVGDSLLVPA